MWTKKTNCFFPFCCQIYANNAINLIICANVSICPLYMCDAVFPRLTPSFNSQFKYVDGSLA